MAKRLSKALRGKRRWFGIAIDSRYVKRSDLQKTLDLISKDLVASKDLRLMDFFNSEHQHFSHIDNDIFHDIPFTPFGLAIVEVPLEVSRQFREIVSSDFDKNTSIISLTTSGKIRLVRQRLNLPKPKRRK